MLESGSVVGFQGANARVLIKRTSACGKCTACGMLKNMSELIVDVPNVLGAREGDRVRVEFSERMSLVSTLIAYMIPLAMLFIGVFLGYYIGKGYFPTVNPEMIAACVGIAFTLLSFGIIKLMDPAIKKRIQFKMVSIERKERDECQS